MKIRFIRDDMLVARKFIKEFDAATMRQDDSGRNWYWRTDVEFEQSLKDARVHVGMANAIPVDAEAKEHCADLLGDWDKKLVRREALAKGIIPEDMERFESGQLAGYDTDGNDIPGPNAIEDEEED